MHDVRRLPVGEGNEGITIALDELERLPALYRAIVDRLLGSV